MRHFNLIFGIILITNLCFGQENISTIDQQTEMRTVKCIEVIQTTNYTYLHVSENDSLIWIAVPKMNAQKDETYYFVGGMDMGVFTSKELNRTFDQMLFLAKLSSVPKHNSTGENVHQAEIKKEKQNVKIELDTNYLTIKELYNNKEKYADKEVTVKGQVTKFSTKIMSRNWIHIQDGTNDEINFDLTITTDETVNIGDIVIIKGKLTIDKDFGYGYFYNVLIEEGKIIKN